MFSLNEFHNLTVNFFLCIRRACKGCIASEILVCHCFHCHHIKIITHAITGDHGTCNLGCLFDIVGSTCCHFTKNNFFCGTSTGESRNLIFQFFLREKIFVSLLYLHGVAKCTGSSRDDRDLLNRCGMCLHGCHKSMSDLMV